MITKDKIFRFKKISIIKIIIDALLLKSYLGYSILQVANKSP